MTRADTTSNRQSTFDLLQTELNQFVAQTEHRLQSLAESLSSSGQEIQVASYCSQVESSQMPSEPIRCGERVASTADDQNHHDTDPLSRLAAMKQRLAARMEDRNDRK